MKPKEEGSATSGCAYEDDGLSYTVSDVLKLINNSSSLNKGNHDCDRVWISLLAEVSHDEAK